MYKRHFLLLGVKDILAFHLMMFTESSIRGTSVHVTASEPAGLSANYSWLSV